MAAPNIVSVTSIIGESQGFELGTTVTTELITVASNKLVKILQTHILPFTKVHEQVTVP